MTTSAPDRANLRVNDRGAPQATYWIVTRDALDTARTAVTECLDKLATADGVEAVGLELAAQGVKAECGEPMRCAIALHVWRQTGYVIEVCPSYVMIVGVCLDLVDDFATGPFAHNPKVLETPSVVRDFISAFDAGRFPALEAGTVGEVYADLPPEAVAGVRRFDRKINKTMAARRAQAVLAAAQTGESA